MNDALLNFLESRGIHSKVTFSHSPYQTGLVEPHIRTLQDKVRTLLAQGNVPLTF